MKDNDFIMLGEILLKRGPSIYNSKKEEIDELTDIINDLEFDLSKENPDFRAYPLLEGYKQLKEDVENSKGKLDYSGTDSFYQIIDINETEIKLREVGEWGYYTEIKTYSITKIKNDFVKLSDFLQKATFVGREFRRTQPIIDANGVKDRSYTKDDDGFKIIVLYATQDLFLVKIIKEEDFGFEFEEEYGLINSRYTLDGKYIFFGPIHDEYKDVNKVYSEILKQISPNDKNKRK